MTQQTQFYPLQGGLNLIAPAIRTPPGHAIAAENYEPVPRGYQRFIGYERLDGQPKPSEASYWVLNFDNGSAAINGGDIVDGDTSGASGKALIDAVVTSGSYGGGDAAGYLVLTLVSGGPYQDNEPLKVSAVTKATADGVEVQRGASNDTDDATWLQDAIETARALIAAVPGSGPVRGVWAYAGDVYAFRDNAGATAGIMHKATAAGWAAQSFGRILDFTSGGTYEVKEGDTITGASSSATATVERVVVQSGDWSTSDAAGYFVLSGQAGTFSAENLDVGANPNVATIAGDSSAIALPAGGRYDFKNYNFYGNSNLRRMYFANGVGYAHEWDGTVLTPIKTGMTTDTPNRVEAHKKHLFLSFPGGSVQHSSIGFPYPFNPVTGAAEIAIGDDVTGMVSTLQVLVITARNSVHILYGNDSSDWDLKGLADESGAVAWTMQRIGEPMFLDDRGVRTLRATQAFGDFNLGTVTQPVEKLIEAKKKAGLTAVASMRVRARDMYRLFWSDGTGLTIYLGRKDAEILPFSLGKTVECTCSAEDANGNEILLYGDDSGFVYQLDKGTSFDGSVVQAYLRLPFNHVGSPAQLKCWAKATLEMDGGQSTQIGLVAEYAYADPDQPSSQEQSFDVKGGGGFWDEFTWDEFYWSSPVEGLAEAPLEGLGQNVSIAVVSESTYEAPHTIHGLTLHFTYRGLKR